jgi:cold shock CspA family protein
MGGETSAAIKKKRLTSAPTYITFSFNCFDDEDNKKKHFPEILIPEEVSIPQQLQFGTTKYLRYGVMCTMYHCSKSSEKMHIDGWYESFTKQVGGWTYYDGLNEEFKSIDGKNMGRMRTIEYDEMLCLATYQRIDDEGPISSRIVNDSICIPRINLGSCAERRKNYQLNNCPDRSSGHSNQPIPRNTTATLVRLVAHTDEIPRAPSSRSPSEIGNYDRSRSSNNHLPTRDLGTIKTFFPQRGYGFISSHSDSRNIFFHISDVNLHTNQILREGDQVEYDVIRGRESGKLQGINVNVLPMR